jgi:hypothetical protein
VVAAVGRVLLVVVAAGDRVSGRCRCGEWAVAFRWRPTSVGTRGPSEPVCRGCCAEADRLVERCVRGMAQVDRAVRSAGWR